LPLSVASRLTIAAGCSGSWLLRQLEQDNSDLSHVALAEIAVAGGAFDDLAAEPDLYSFSDGEAIVAG